jgi:hypothetical protein
MGIVMETEMGCMGMGPRKAIGRLDVARLLFDIKILDNGIKN